jgi:lysophospholipase L1-like esterase
MAERIVIITISILLLFGAPASASASSDSAHGHDSGEDSLELGDGERARSRNIIWEGLCVGASLDLSRASQKSCARQADRAAEDREKRRMDERRDDKDHKKDRRRDKHKDDDRSEEVEAAETVEYAALGDSVAAGLGLESPADSDERCGRTFDAYPYEIANERGLEITHLACTGATLGDLFTEQRISGPNPDPQLETAFAGGTPELITITAGANDIRWDYFLRKCYTGTCGTSNDERIANGLLAALNAKMQFLFLDIERRSSGSPPGVVMTGYYDPLSDRCSEVEPRLTPDEIAWLSAQTDSLNQALENAGAQHDFVTFVPIDFSGHDVCSDDPWVQSIDDPAPFHPTFEGQQAMARAIL